MEFKDYYQTLGVARSASEAEIKSAYRKLARKFHPDLSKEKNAEARFKEVQEAYEVLKDPEKRTAYDQFGANWQQGQDFRPPPGWDAGFEFRGRPEAAGPDAAEADFSDFFESLFGRTARARRGSGGSRGGDFRMRGEDHHARILIDLEDAYAGATRTITLRNAVVGADGHPQLAEHSVKVTIPKGVRAGQMIRLAGQGTPGMGGGAAGDLYLEIAFNPHALYRVEGRDVYLDLPIAPWEAALGRKVTAPTPAGPVDLTIPAGSANGRRLRLKGKGIPGQEPGDFYAVLNLVLPAAQSAQARALYEEMERKLAFNPRQALGV